MRLASRGDPSGDLDFFPGTLLIKLAMCLAACARMLYHSASSFHCVVCEESKS